MGTKVVHRVTNFEEVNEKRTYTTQGINNQYTEEDISLTQIIGKIDLSLDAYLAVQQMSRNGRIHFYNAFGLSRNSLNLYDSLLYDLTEGLSISIKELSSLFFNDRSKSSKSTSDVNLWNWAYPP